MTTKEEFVASRGGRGGGGRGGRGGREGAVQGVAVGGDVLRVDEVEVAVWK
jgi:hypothetical protein